MQEENKKVFWVPHAMGWEVLPSHPHPPTSSVPAPLAEEVGLHTCLAFCVYTKASPALG